MRRAARLRWLSALLAGVIALAALVTPAQHAAMVWSQMAEHAASAAPDRACSADCARFDGHEGHAHSAANVQQRTAPDLRPERGDHSGHAKIAQLCDACLLFAAPGVPPGSPWQGEGVGRSRAVRRLRDGRTACAGRRWPPQQARGPPRSFR